jgi:hypothetical protein
MWSVAPGKLCLEMVEGQKLWLCHTHHAASRCFFRIGLVFVVMLSFRLPSLFGRTVTLVEIPDVNFEVVPAKVLQLRKTGT